MGLQVDPKELKKRQFFLEGNIPKAVLSVCLPMALFQLINELFRVFDLVITSQINPESVSAVSFFNQLNNSIVSVGTGLSIGAGILIAGLYGAGEYERLKTTVNTTFFMAGAAALVLVAGLILGLAYSAFGKHSRPACGNRIELLPDHCAESVFHLLQ